MPVLIDTSALVKFGDLTSGGGLSAAINPSDGGATGYKTATTGWAGVTLGTASAVSHVEVTSATNGFDASGSATQITLKLYGKQGSAPTSATNGTLLGTMGPFTDVNSATTRTIASTDTSTAWNHLWVVGTTGVWFITEAMKFYAPDPPAGAPQPIDSERYILRSVCNTATLLGYQLTQLNGFNQDVRIETDAVATFNFRADIVHRGGITGYNDALSLGGVLFYKKSATWAGIPGASWQQIANGVAGRNLCERNPQHYETLHVTGALDLEAGNYYRFGIQANAKTDTPPYQTTDGLAGLLVEGGGGLNQFLTTIDHGAVLVAMN